MSTLTTTESCALHRRNKAPIARLDAVHDAHDKVAAAAPAKEVRNLSPSLLLARGARVMLTANLWVEIGLTNGAPGIVRGIVWPDNSERKSGQLPVIKLMSHYPNY